MESNLFRNFEFDRKEEGIQRSRIVSFSRIVTSLRQILEVLVVFALISMSTAVNASFRSFFEFAAPPSSHRAVFLIGNAIIVLLFVICRRNDYSKFAVRGNEFYVDRSKSRQREPAPAPGSIEATAEGLANAREEEKHMVVCKEYAKVRNQKCDDLEIAMEKASRRIRRFERTQSEKLRRKIAGRTAAEHRRSETDYWPGSGDNKGIESLSSEEFRLTVDAFIDKHWSRAKEE